MWFRWRVRSFGRVFSDRTSAITPRGLRLQNGLTYAAWANVGQSLRVFASASAWCLGDWFAYGEDAYPSRYRDAVDATGLEYQTLRNYAWVARRFEMSRRRDTISFQHHAEVAALGQAVQDLWLDRCERFRWSRAELRREIRQARRDAGPSPLCSVGVCLTITVDGARERRWRDAAANLGQAFDDWLAASADTAADAVLVQRRTSSDRVAVSGTRGQRFLLS
jgi:hypothetical protein